VVKYDTSICNYRGKKRKKLRKKVKDQLSIEIWIFRNGQQDRDHDDTMFVAMTSAVHFACTRVYTHILGGVRVADLFSSFVLFYYVSEFRVAMSVTISA
jgi:hypothetical protein